MDTTRKTYVAPALNAEGDVVKQTLGVELTGAIEPGLDRYPQHSA
jgi:hypothetical protein